MTSDTGEKAADLSISVSIPLLFKCPISLELMTDPVALCTGMSYDRASIEKWLDEGNNVCPATQNVLHNKELIPNHILRRLIQQWCVANCVDNVIRISPPKLVAEASKMLQMIRNIQDGTRSLAQVSERNRQFLQSEGVLPVLIHVLDSEASLNSDMDGDREAVEEAIGAISLFSVDDISNKRCFTRPFVLATLEWVLATCTLKARLNAAYIVEKLANDRNSARQFGSTQGVAEGLMKLFEENVYPSAIKASLKALFPLCTVHKNKANIAKLAGIVPRLIQLLPGADTSMAEQSLAILEALSSVSEGRFAIVSHALAVPTIIRSLLAVSDTATSYAIGILLRICFNSAEEELLIEVVEMGTLERLLFLLQVECSPSTKQKANELLRMLSPVH